MQYPSSLFTLDVIVTRQPVEKENMTYHFHTFMA